MPKAPTGRTYIGVAAMSAASLLFGSVSALPAYAAPEEEPKAKAALPQTIQPPTDRFIVGFSGAAKSSAAERSKAYGKVAKENGISVKEVKGTTNGSQVVKADRKLTEAESKEMIADLKAQPNVSYVEADILLQPALTPNDPYFPQLWNLFDHNTGLRVPSVWDKTTAAGQVVAVIDTGHVPHSDIEANMLPGYDFISDADNARDGNGRDSNPLDQGDWRVSGDCGVDEPSNSSWHGLHVAGSIAAIGNNSEGITGAAPGAKILPLRVLGKCGGYMSDIADAVIWASGGAVAGVPLNQNPAKVLNLSLGGWGACSVTVQNAVNSAVSRGSTLIVAAGNNNMNVSNHLPANCDNVVAVASSGQEGWRAYYSNYGEKIDVTAPGGEMINSVDSGILSTINTGDTVPAGEGYAYYQGTSMATPMVASVAALVLATNPTLTPAQLEARLKETTRTLPFHCEEGCGTGLVNAERAVDPSIPSDIPEGGGENPSEELTSSIPEIMGTFRVGSTLMVNAGEWGPAPVELSYQWYRYGEAIAGATSPSYTITPADIDSYIGVAVTGHKDGYYDTTQYSDGGYVTEGGMRTGVPTIVGEAKVGGYLQGDKGEWGPEGINYTYQWYRNGALIPGATNDMYGPSAADAEKVLTFSVTGTKEGYEPSTVTSQGVTVATGTFTTQTPVISGDGFVGSVLTAETGAWGPYPLTLSHQWFRNGVAITGATTSQYKVIADDAEKNITVAVTAKREGYTTVTKTSAAKAISAYYLTGAKPVIEGVAKVGSTLTANPGTWGPAPVTLSYQWYRDGVAITGATGSTRVLTAEDAGKPILVAVTGSKTGFATQTSLSNPTAAVAAGTLTVGTPVITGTAKVGSTVTAAPGTWGPAPVTLSYQWYRSGVAIAGATASTRVLAAEDAGKVLTVTVTGSKAGYATASKASAGTAAVAAGTLIAGNPSITGLAKVGYKLTANPGTWGPAPVTLTYQWKRAGVAIAGATASSYVLTSADLGKSITVTVTGSKAGYVAAAKTSVGTAATATGTLTSPVPVIGGTVKVGYALTANPGVWTSGTTLKYQWYRSGVAIAGATASKYVLTGADYNKVMSVRVTGSKAGYYTVTKTSANTRAVVIGTLVAGNPTISGTARSGYTLTAKPGTWTAGTTLKYQWYRSGVAIAGATGASYRLVTADRYDTIKVRVVGSKAGYTSVLKYSASTVRIP